MFSIRALLLDLKSLGMLSRQRGDSPETVALCAEALGLICAKYACSDVQACECEIIGLLREQQSDVAATFSR